MYRPKDPFTVPMLILKPCTKTVKMVSTKMYPKPSEVSIDMQVFASFRTFGGTEVMSNVIVTTIDTAVIETWFRPDITADCQIYVCETGKTYDIIGTPEDIDMRHQFLKFKVKAVGGKP